MSQLNRTEKKAILEVLYVAQGGFCCWCDMTLLTLDRLPIVKSGKLPDDYPTIEHVVKREHGGKNKVFNFKLSCPKCNSTRDGADGNQ